MTNMSYRDKRGTNHRASWLLTRIEPAMVHIICWSSSRDIHIDPW